MAAAAMLGSSLLVMINSLRLGRDAGQHDDLDGAANRILIDDE